MLLCKVNQQKETNFSLVITLIFPIPLSFHDVNNCNQWKWYGKYHHCNLWNIYGILKSTNWVLTPVQSSPIQVSTVKTCLCNRWVVSSRKQPKSCYTISGCLNKVTNSINTTALNYITINTDRLKLLYVYLAILYVCIKLFDQIPDLIFRKFVANNFQCLANLINWYKTVSISIKLNNKKIMLQLITQFCKQQCMCIYVISNISSVFINI